MDQIQYSCAAPTQRSRASVFFRYFLVLPHAFFVSLYGIAAQCVVIVHWFAIVLTGKRNQSMWNFTERYARYSTRVTAYMQLQHDQFPAFSADDPTSPVDVSFPFNVDANRLTTLFRIIMLIPAFIIGYALSIGASFALFISWFAIVLTGKQPDAFHDFIGKVLAFSTRLTGYSLLLVDTYPKYA